MPTYIEFPTLGKTVEVGDDINEDGIADIYDTLSRQQFRAQQGQKKQGAERLPASSFQNECSSIHLKGIDLFLLHQLVEPGNLFAENLLQLHQFFVDFT